MAYEVHLSGQAQKLLRKLPRDVQRRALKKARSLGDDPRPRGVEKMKGEWAGYWRIEIGKSYRIVYVIEGSVVTVTWVGPREDAPYD